MKEKLFNFYEKVITRSPAFPYSILFSEENQTKKLEEVVVSLVSNGLFVESIYWSSPQLYQQVLNYKNESSNPIKNTKLMTTLKKYVIRASTRCTPYGTFAGCDIHNTFSKLPCNEKSAMRIARIDMALLHLIKNLIESDEKIWQHLRYKINETLYNIREQYRFIETIIENGQYNYQISSIEATAILEKIILLGKTKTISFADIKNLLYKQYTEEEIGGFMKTLIVNQFFISELSINPTGKNELDRFKTILREIQKKENIPNIKKYATLFSHIEQVITKLNSAPLGEVPYQEIEHLKKIIQEHGIKDVPEHLFHVDLLNPTSADITLSTSEINNIENAVSMMSKLSATITSHETTLNLFKKIFREKYDCAEIPLLEVLDPESGIGFLPRESIGDTVYNSVLGNINVPSKSEAVISLDKAQLWLEDILETITPHEMQHGICLEEYNLDSLEDKIKELPNQISITGTKLPSGNIYIQNIGGANANSLLGRFAYMNDEFNSFSKLLAEDEINSQKNTLFAEIAHTPEGRTGNVARRVKLYDYEIPILSSSSNNEQTIRLDDIHVSVIQDEIILRSARLNKRIVPRLNNAHNYSKSIIPVYKFLAALQHQGRTGLGINWGTIVNKKRFLPRISYKNIILHRATWYIQPRDIEIITSSNNPSLALKNFFRAWNVPQLICMTEADNELFIDTQNDSYIEILLEKIKKRSPVKLVEWLHHESNANNLHNVSQFILPVSKKEIKPISSFVPYLKSENNITKTFAPGSEWIYYKIYCGAFVSDSILNEVVKPTITSLLKMNIIKKAFFIRYKDPHYHLRFRMQLKAPCNKYHFATATSYFHEQLRPFYKDRSVWKIQMDTYEREIERYGSSSMLISENAFFQDSLLFLDCLSENDFTGNEQIRFLSGMKNVDKWLSLFGMDTASKLELCNRASDNFLLEFDKQLKLQLDMKYRMLKEPIHQFFQSNLFDDYFKTRDEQLNKLQLPQENLLSYIHMSQNRWFQTQQRLLEYMAYYFCRRHYTRLLYAN
ncbi:hypothetical protein A9P82_12035 [Arachidicoccus ginsenosidimutans]|uniref:lantibiotic dehydratase n=1 Tax=Arachidicoccus sp. BS20 TaxID=1850526 RepID=UPI0007F13F5B|nr:lantibiotic dehydratase [Arachidicoccus sp. BS20]ANI89953.1 hypothetical protein A9P82_12035 [Arachidicoccus sp. BS20]